MATIDLNRVAVFVRVVETGGFTAAAKQLGLPGSSVSRAVAKLENELGVRLLHRTTRRLRLTDAGQHFFARMQKVIAEAEDATTAVGGFATEPRGVVRMTAPPGLGAMGLPKVIARIVQRYPGVVLELMLTNRVIDLVAEGIDLAIRAGRLEDSSLVARKVSPSEIGVFAAPAYLARRGRPRRPADLSKHDCLSYGSREGKLPWRLRGPDGERVVAVSGPIVCDDMGFLHDVCAAGLGLAMLPVELASAPRAKRSLMRVLPRYAFPSGGMHVVWPSQKLVPASVAAVRDQLIRELSAPVV